MKRLRENRGGFLVEDEGAIRISVFVRVFLYEFFV